jgi:hypothetical protein
MGGMNPYLEVIAREWAERADELADWAMARLVNRTDVWGAYLARAKRVKQTFFTAPFRDARGKEFLTRAHLARHFAGLDGHLISLHSTSADKTSRWLAVDIDRHEGDETSTPEGNLAAALAWHDRLVEMGWDPLLMDSNGNGGYHLLMMVTEPVPTSDFFAFGAELICNWPNLGLAKEPETYPRQASLEEGHYGNCLRVPGRHYSRDHYTRVWSGEPGLENPWLEGGGAVDRILQTRPSPPSMVPSRGAPSKLRRKPSKQKKERPRVCVDLDGVLAAYDGWKGLDFTGAPLPGAVEFTRRLSEFADVVIYSTRGCVELHREELGEPTRPASDLAPRLQQKLKYWLDKHRFHYAEIYIGQGKPMASAYIDDRAVACRPQEEAGDFDRAVERARQLASRRRRG